MLIIGLGNPGKKYEKTYHNAGFLFIDYLTGKNPADDLILLKPTTFMNESGKSVKEALKRFSVKPEEILVVHDDSDIELGKYKISFGRNSAGHRGVESIIKSIGTKNFRRLRIGIGKISNIKKDPPGILRKQKLKRMKAGELVLKKINKKDWGILEKVFQIIFNYIRINQLYQR